MLCLFVCILILQKQVECQEYLEVGFTNIGAIPTKTAVGNVTDTTGKVWTRYSLSCPNTAIEDAFLNYIVVEFEKEYPHATSGILTMVYKVRTLNNHNALQSSLLAINTTDIDNVYKTTDPVLTSFTNPNDYYSSNHTGDSYFHSAKKHLDLINVKKGWEYTRGDASVVIGITDAAFYKHSDLDSKVLNIGSFTVNTTFPPVASNIGINSYNTPVCNPNPPYNCAPTPYYYHGTEVASLAAAIADNNFGIVGVGNKVSLKYYPMTYDGIYQAADEGCKVINCSWGGTNTLNPYAISVLDFAVNKKATIVASAGNGLANPGSLTAYMYPASFPISGIISVTSVGCQYPVGSSYNGNQESWPDYHQRFIGTPSSTHTHNDRVDLTAPGYAICLLQNGNGQGQDNGTSMSAPIVAGAAALLYSLNPNFTPVQVEDYLKRVAKDIYGVGNNYLYAGQLGTGRLDVGKSLQLVDDEDKACMPKINDIVWKDGSTTISNNDYWNGYTTINFEVAGSTIPSNSILEWEFISGNDVVTKTGNNPSITWGTDFSYYVGPFLRHEKLPLEVYVRQKNTTATACFSAYKKESGFHPNVEGGNYANQGVYPSNNCDGNVFITDGIILPGDIKGLNIYVGKSFAGATTGNVYAQNYATEKLSAANEIILAPGTHILRPPVSGVSWAYGTFQALIDVNCNIPNWYRPAPTKPNPQYVKNDIKNTTEIAISNIIVPEQNENLKSNIRIYPNPTSNNVSVDLYHIKDGNVQITIGDINGKTVLKYSQLKKMGKQHISINVGSLVKGIYFVKIITQDKQYVQHIVKL